MESSLVFVLTPAVMSAYLFDWVAGSYRFVARGQVPSLTSPEATVVDDARAAMTEVERLTGRSLTLHGEPVVPATVDGCGVDVMAAVCAPGGVLRVAVVAGTEDLAVDSAPRAVCGAGHEVVYTLALDGHEAASPEGLFEAVRQLRLTRPDVVLVAAQGEGVGAERLPTFATALGAPEVQVGTEAPALLFAGEDSQLAVLVQGVGDRFPLQTAQRLRPAPGEESLEPVKAALYALHAERWCAQLPGFERFAAWLKRRPVPLDIALSRMFRFLAAAANGPVWGIDFDRAGPGLFLATPSSLSAFRMRLSFIPMSQSAAWLPSDPGDGAFAQAIVNLLMRPAALPATADEALYEGALLRAQCRLALDDPRRPVVEPALGGEVGRVVGTGPGTACAPGAVDAALLLLDAAQPVGVGYLQWDPLSLLAPIGALASLEPRAAADLALNEAAASIGFYVAPAGTVRPGGTAVSLEATYADKSSLRLEVASGTVEALPVPPSGQTTLDIKLVERLDVGAGGGRRFGVSVPPTALGVVVDARGRPIAWPVQEAERRRLLVASRRPLGARVSEEVRG